MSSHCLSNGFKTLRLFVAFDNKYNIHHIKYHNFYMVTLISKEMCRADHMQLLLYYTV